MDVTDRWARLSVVSLSALTSAEISLPAGADGVRVSDRIAVLADTVDVVGLTDNHAGQPRMSPLAAVALAREQGVGTIVHTDPSQDSANVLGAPPPISAYPTALQKRALTQETPSS